MRFSDFKIINESPEPDIIQALRDFLPMAITELGIARLPKIKFMSQLENEDQPTFGTFSYDGTDAIIELNIANRHPVDILRTLAHELVHYKQLLNKQLDQNSGETGSPEENEAHVVAGVIMRHFDKQYPDYLKSESISITEDITENFKDGKNPGRKGLAKRSGVNTKASVSSLRKTAKSSSGEKQRMAHWLANMKSGRKKKKANEAVAPHGTPENEFELMKAGTKPAALVNPHTFLELYKPVADELGWPYQQVKIAGHQYDNYVVGQPGEEKRVQRLVTLLQDMNANLALGMKPNKHYHIEMGKLLGYSNQDIQDFLKNINLDEDDTNQVRYKKITPKPGPPMTLMQKLSKESGIRGVVDSFKLGLWYEHNINGVSSVASNTRKIVYDNLLQDYQYYEKLMDKVRQEKK